MHEHRASQGKTTCAVAPFLQQRDASEYNNHQSVFPHALVPTGGVNHTYSDTSVYGRDARGSSGRRGALLSYLEGNRWHSLCQWLTEVACAHTCKPCDNSPRATGRVSSSLFLFIRFSPSPSHKERYIMRAWNTKRERGCLGFSCVGGLH